MSKLTKSDLLNFGKQLVAVDLSVVAPELAGLDGLYVRSLNAGDRLLLDEARAPDTRYLGDHEFVLLGCYDSNGKRFFTPQEAAELDGRIAGYLARRVIEVSGMGKTSSEDAEKK